MIKSTTNISEDNAPVLRLQVKVGAEENLKESDSW